MECSEETVKSFGCCLHYTEIRRTNQKGHRRRHLITPWTHVYVRASIFRLPCLFAYLLIPDEAIRSI